jgi:hypothetical protein
MSEKNRYGEEFESLLVEWNAEFDKLETMMGDQSYSFDILE